MTTTYNKRPKVRGRVHDAEKSSAAPAFIEWVHPKTAPLRFIMSLFGVIPLIVLALADWAQIQAGYLSVGDAIALNKLKLLTDTSVAATFGERWLAVGETLAERVFTPREADAVAEFMVRFENFSWIFMLIAGMLVCSAMFVLFSMFACKTTKARAALAYIGFGIGAITPFVFIYAMSTINGMLGQRIMQVSFYPYLLILAGLLAMVYCVRFPILTAIKNKRNSVFTRAVTTFVPVKGDGVKEGVRKVIFTTALISFIYFASTLGGDLFIAVRDWLNQRRLNAQIGADVDINDPRFDSIRDLNPLPEYLALWKLNNDMVGYIKLGETRLDYPVLQHETNGFYLDHNFDKQPDKYGAVFADWKNRFEGLEISDNTILYGHNTSTGNFFAPLTNFHPRGMRFNNLEFYKTNPVIQFDTLYERMEWKIFACVLFNTQERFGEKYNYWHSGVIDFDDEDLFHNHILDVMDRSVIFTDVDIEFGDNILTLSTCFWPYGQSVDTRLVVFARRVRPGESNQVNVERAFINDGVLRFQHEANQLGDVWNGRVWDYKTYLPSYNGD